jgi:hypothetical protein
VGGRYIVFRRARQWLDGSERQASHDSPVIGIQRSRQKISQKQTTTKESHCDALKPIGESWPSAQVLKGAERVGGPRMKRTFVYDLPSSLMRRLLNEQVAAAASKLDAKLGALADLATGASA